MLADEPGGSGTFYYAALVLGDGRPAATAPIGDRIKLQSITFVGDDIVVKYLDRRPDEPMVAKPTIAQTLRLKPDATGEKLVEAARGAS